MKKFSFNHGTFVVNKDHVQFEIPIKYIFANSLQEIEDIYDVGDFGFETLIETFFDQSTFVLSYLIEPDFFPLDILRQKDDPQLKISSAESLIEIGLYFESQDRLVTVFEPPNFFVSTEGKVKFLYRGVAGLMPAQGYEEEPIIDQVKRLILYLFTDARFSELNHYGLSYADRKLDPGSVRIGKRILRAGSFEQMTRALQAERRELRLGSPSSLKQKRFPFFGGR